MNRTGLCVAVLVLGLAHGAWAQKKVLTAAYLRASIGALDERSSVIVRGEYLIDPGMIQSDGRALRNKGYSRFSIRDPQTGIQFSSLYCKQESDVFWALLKADANKLFTFYGEKGRGEQREGAIFVDRLEAVLMTPEEIANRGQEDAATSDEKPLRITITKDESGTRTVLTNVQRGSEVKVEGLTIVVEDEPDAGL